MLPVARHEIANSGNELIQLVSFSGRMFSNEEQRMLEAC